MRLIQRLTSRINTRRAEKTIANQNRLIPDRNSPDQSDQLLPKQNQSGQSFMQAGTTVCSLEGPHSQKPHSCAELPCFASPLNRCHTRLILQGRKKPQAQITKKVRPLRALPADFPAKASSMGFPSLHQDCREDAEIPQSEHI